MDKEIYFLSLLSLGCAFLHYILNDKLRATPDVF